jgi:hypothetical protein
MGSLFADFDRGPQFTIRFKTTNNIYIFSSRTVSKHVSFEQPYT